jgi:exonuclease SbcC
VIIRSLTLENIRSYKDETTIQFPAGTILFEGDIASGKSTMLYAIEFALFGLGDMKASSLLRNGARRGDVKLTFEVDGKEYQVHRGLAKKGKLVQQEDCRIDGPEGRAVLSATELKEKILQILGFNESANPRAQSVIYRYAIFTPQEEMKEVILKDPDERLQTLRKAFRIEDYKIATDNTSTVLSRIRDRTRFLEGATQDIDAIKGKIDQEEKQVEQLTTERTALQGIETELKLKIGDKEEALKKLQNDRERIGQTKNTIPLLQGQIAEKNNQIGAIGEQNETLKKKIDEEIQPKIKRFGEVKKPTEKTKEQLVAQQTELSTKLVQSQKLKGGLEERIGNFNSLIEKGVCPVCERPVNPEDFQGKSQHLAGERSRLDEEIEGTGKSITETNVLIESLTEFEGAQSQLSLLHDQLEQANITIDHNSHTINDLMKSVGDLQRQLDSALEDIKPLQKVSEDIERLDNEIKTLRNELNEVGKDVSSKQTAIQKSEENKNQLKEELNKKQTWRENLKSLNEHKVWLDQYVAPTVENIEKHVMTSINQRFNDQFQRWFRILIDDPDMQVRINEEFTPIIEHEGYEQDYPALSGGERTSLALAYRLALNRIVQEVSISGGSNLLILDEPTDGFSKEQVFKIRDILEELRFPQVILVSHERELEGFADHVFKIQKSDGISEIVGNE